MGFIPALIGGIVSVVGSIKEGQAKAEQATFEQQQANQNAILARQQASEEERRFRMSAGREQGQQRADVGASGVTTEGSIGDVLEQNARNMELDALTIRHQGEIKAQGYQNEATAAGMRKSNAQTGAVLSAAGTLFGTAERVVDKLPKSAG